jgi:hypothetical protein
MESDLIVVVSCLKEVGRRQKSSKKVFLFAAFFFTKTKFIHLNL